MVHSREVRQHDARLDSDAEPIDRDFHVRGRAPDGFFGDEAAKGEYLTGPILHLSKTRVSALASWLVIALVTGRGI